MLRDVVRAVQVVKAIQRIKPGHRHKPAVPPERATFFSVADVWIYEAIMDTRVCPVCLGHEKTEIFRGNHLRAHFPFLEIMDVNTIQVNAHPNCRCFLVRVIQG